MAPKSIQFYCNTNLFFLSFFLSGKRLEIRHVREKIQLALCLSSDCTVLLSSNLAILTKDIFNGCNIWVVNRGLFKRRQQSQFFKYAPTHQSQPTYLS